MYTYTIVSWGRTYSSVFSLRFQSYFPGQKIVDWTRSSCSISCSNCILYWRFGFSL